MVLPKYPACTGEYHDPVPLGDKTGKPQPTVLTGGLGEASLKDKISDYITNILYTFIINFYS
jgi:hypothetical protein